MDPNVKDAAAGVVTPALPKENDGVCFVSLGAAVGAAGVGAVGVGAAAGV